MKKPSFFPSDAPLIERVTILCAATAWLYLLILLVRFVAKAG